MREHLLSEVLEALIVIRGLVVQKTKLINDCNRLLKDLLDSLLLESNENKRQFIQACISGLQIHGDENRGRTSLVRNEFLDFPKEKSFGISYVFGYFEFLLWRKYSAL